MFILYVIGMNFQVKEDMAKVPLEVEHGRFQLRLESMLSASWKVMPSYEMLVHCHNNVLYSEVKLQESMAYWYDDDFKTFSTQRKF